MTTSSPPKLLLAHAFSTFAVGGAQRRFAQLAAAFKDVHQHRVFAMDNCFDAKAIIPDGVDLTTVPMTVRKSGGLSLGNLRGFRAALAKDHPALLLTYNWGAVEWALANRFAPLVPHVHFEDGFGPEESPSRQLPRRVLMRRLALSGRTRIVVPSLTLKKLATEIWGFAETRVRHIPNGIDLAAFDRPKTRGAVFPFGPEHVVVLALGALRPEKNLARLIKAFAKLPADTPARLAIVGDGPSRAGLETLAAELSLGKRVHFAGYADDPAAALAEADLLAVSSDTEQMPLNVIEAMAAGLPVLATNVGDIAHMLPESAAPFIVPPENEDAYADALARLFASAEDRARQGAANRAWAQSRFDEARMVDAYSGLFDEMTMQGRRAHMR